jgi:peptidoglycan/xylan/chitin deacetylase (PgdA/CDA1 family)
MMPQPIGERFEPSGAYLSGSAHLETAVVTARGNSQAGLRSRRQSRSRSLPPLVLCYHALSEAWEAPLSVTPRQFERQVATLTRLRFRGITFTEAVAGRFASRTVAITFDDAYRSVLELAEPILAHHGMPATVFVPTAFPSQTVPMAWAGIDHWRGTRHAQELRCLTWDELTGLHERGWEIGSHTETHPRLTEVDDDRLDHEARASRAACEEAIGARCRTLAYPYGDHDDRVIAATRAAGYDAAAALPSPLTDASNPFSYPRIGIYNGDGAARFALKISPIVRRLRAPARHHREIS